MLKPEILTYNRKLLFYIIKKNFYTLKFYNNHHPLIIAIQQIICLVYAYCIEFLKKIICNTIQFFYNIAYNVYKVVTNI